MSFQDIHRREAVLVGHVIADKDRHASRERRFAHEGMDCRSLVGVPRLDLAHHLTMHDPKVPGGRMDQILDLVPNPPGLCHDAAMGRVPSRTAPLGHRTVGLAFRATSAALRSLPGPAAYALADAAVLPLAAIPLSFLAALTEYRLWDLEPISRDLVSATMDS